MLFCVSKQLFSSNNLKSILDAAVRVFCLLVPQVLPLKTILDAAVRDFCLLVPQVLPLG